MGENSLNGMMRHFGSQFFFGGGGVVVVVDVVVLHLHLSDAWFKDIWGRLIRNCTISLLLKGEEVKAGSSRWKVASLPVPKAISTMWWDAVGCRGR